MEAIPEVLEMKQEMFQQAGGNLRAGDNYCIQYFHSVANTPFGKDETQGALAGGPFLESGPPGPLVEVCGSPATLPEVTQATMAILKKIGNKPVLMRKEILGFLGNRIMHAMNREALALIGAGVCDAEDIDMVVNASFGPRFANLGPMEYLDFSGLDLIKNIQGYLYGDLDNTPGVLPVVDKLVEEGNLGLKTGKGLFDWSTKGESHPGEPGQGIHQKGKGKKCLVFPVPSTQCQCKVM